jgi:hypothetical protein
MTDANDAFKKFTQVIDGMTHALAAAKFVQDNDEEIGKCFKQAFGMHPEIEKMKANGLSEQAERKLRRLCESFYKAGVFDNVRQQMEGEAEEKAEADDTEDLVKQVMENAPEGHVIDEVHVYQNGKMRTIKCKSFGGASQEDTLRRALTEALKDD